MARWRLTEPLRFYVWPALSPLPVVIAALAVAGEWLLAAVVVGQLVTLLLTIGAARASVYSPAGMVRSLREAVGERR
jgi:hypothetical protein